MRTLAAVSILVGCGSSPEVPDDHQLHDLSSDTADTLRVRHAGKEVALADLEIARTIGLPVSGTADIAVDITMPKTAGVPVFARAEGTISIACTKCQLGDDKTKLTFEPGTAGARGFLGDGFDFGHLTVDRLEAKVAIGDGALSLTSWTLASPDLELDVAYTMKLAATYADSTVDGCIRFKPTEALEQRDPKTYSLLVLTGASRADDGHYHIKLEGRAGALRRLAKQCRTR